MEQNSNQKDAQRTLQLPPRSISKNHTLPLKIQTTGNLHSDNGLEDELVESSSGRRQRSILNSKHNDAHSLQSGSKLAQRQSDRPNRLALPLIPQPASTVADAKQQSDHDNSSLDDMDDEDRVNELENGRSKNQEANSISNAQNDAMGWKALSELDSLPLMKSGYSLEADMKFGWKPQVKGKILPIPFVFDSEDHLFNLPHFTDRTFKNKFPVIYQGWRPADSFKLYKKILGINHPYHGSNFKFKIPNELPPAIQKLIDQQMQAQVLGGTKSSVQKNRFEGMNPQHRQLYEEGQVLKFDAMFESGNLDRVVMVSPKEYDLYMRPDTNTRGHHQWFFFLATAQSNIGAVKFNIINFTKPKSLYDQGMKVCICSCQEKQQAIDAAKSGKALDTDMAGWKKAGYDISYKRSKLNEIIDWYNESQEDFSNNGGTYRYRPIFYQMSFTYNFNYMDGDQVYFAHSFPYTFTKLTKYLESLKLNQEMSNFVKDQGPLCHSLSGIDIPFLVVTSRVNQENYKKILPEEHSQQSLPEDKMKRVVIITSRVHPGETNASFMVEGLLNFITSTKDPMAQELRKRIIFKIIPCINPDGVMAGNYRVSMSGNDLNRRYLNPHTKLHPVVCAVKKLIKQDENDILAFIDMHGHSRKKNVFMYGPEYPIHDNRYLQMRILPKLMSEQTQMFRYYSCKFRIQPSKEKTARVVLWREFNIMNCYTLEASLHGFFDHTRDTTDFLVSHSIKIGKLLGKSIFEYMIMKEDDEKAIKARREEAKKQKLRIQQQLKKAKPLPEAKDFQSKAMLSPSASSEALNNIDDQQPNEKSKLNHIRKKLLKAQSVEKNSKGQVTSNQKDKNNKKFKLTKKFKDDIQVSAVKKSQANPMEPSDEPEIVPNPNEDLEVVQNDFVAQFKMNKRTLKDLCNQIETEEKDLIKNSQDEGNQSDRLQNATKIDDSCSEEDMLLQEIQDNILGIIDKSDQAPIVVDKKKPKKLQDSSSKKPPNTAQQAGDNRKNKEAGTAQGQNKQKDNPKSQKYNDEKKLSEKKRHLVNGTHNASSKPRAERKGSGYGLMRRESSKVLLNRREPLHPQIDPKIQLAPSQSQIVNHIQQQNQGQQQIQINYNNFNDRIINQSYHKHKKGGPQFGTGYHLTTLSANAQQLLQHQLLQEKAKRERILEYQKSTQKNSVDHKAYAMYNFQPRNSNKIEPQIENTVFSLPPREPSQTNDHRYKLTSKQYNKRTKIDEENIDHINHQREIASYRHNQQATRGPPGFMVTNSQEKQIQSPELEKVQSQLNINRTSTNFNPQGEDRCPQSQQSNEKGFKKRNRRIIEQQNKVIETKNSQTRFVVIQPNKISNHASYQTVMMQNNQQQIQANNLKQQSHQNNQFQAKTGAYSGINTQHLSEQSEANQQRMSGTPIFVPLENISIMKIAKNVVEPSSAGPIIESHRQQDHQSNPKIITNESKQYQLVIEKDTGNKQGRISIVTQKMTDALSKDNGQSRTAPLGSQMMSFSQSTHKDHQSFQNQNHKNEPKVYESASKNRNRFHQFYPNPSGSQGANEAYGLPQKLGSPKSKSTHKFSKLQELQSGYDDQRFNTFATPMKQHLGQPGINVRGNNNLRNENLTTGSKLGLPAMTYTTQEVPKFQLPNENELKRAQDQQLYNFIDLKTPQQNAKSDSGGQNKRNQMPVRHQLSRADNKQYYHQFGERSVPNFEQINEIQIIRNGDTHMPLTMKTSVANQSHTAQKPVRNSKLITKEPAMLHNRQFKTDTKFQRKEHKSESKSQLNHSVQRMHTSSRQQQALSKPHDSIQRGKNASEFHIDSLQEISKDLSNIGSQQHLDSRQRNLDQKCYQFIKSTSKRGDFSAAGGQKEALNNSLYSMDHRRVNFIKNQIKNQQEQFNQEIRGGVRQSTGQSPKKGAEKIKEMNIQF